MAGVVVVGMGLRVGRGVQLRGREPLVGRSCSPRWESLVVVNDARFRTPFADSDLFYE